VARFCGRKDCPGRPYKHRYTCRQNRN
jgi:hypothetical protein